MKKTKIIFITIIIILLLISPAYAYLKQSLIISGKSIINEDKKCNSEVSYIKDTWVVDEYNYYKYTLTLTNKSNRNYYFWDISFDLPSDFEIISTSSCSYSTSLNKVTLSNLDYNGYLELDSKISMEIQFKTKENFELNNISVNNCFYTPTHDPEITDPLKELDIEFVVTNSWGNYTSQYNIVLTNNGNKNITSWSFEIVKENNLSLEGSWSTNYIINDNSIIFSNMDYNNIISPNSKITIGAIITTNVPNYIPKIKNKLVTN